MIVPALLIGPVVLLRKKGDLFHKRLGRVWVILMITGCLLSFGIIHEGGFSWLHGLSLFTIFSVSRGLLAAKKGAIQTHQRNMVGSYLGMLAAFVFALSGDRLVGQLLRDL